jgi:hypothetical protein
LFQWRKETGSNTTSIVSKIKDPVSYSVDSLSFEFLASFSLLIAGEITENVSQFIGKFA